LLHRRKSNEIEEVEQADPDDARNEMKPADDDEFSRISATRKTELGPRGMIQKREQRVDHLPLLRNKQHYIATLRNRAR
jgi:hypothetical protein